MKIKDILTRLAKPAKQDECAEISAILAQLDADAAAARATLAGIAEKRVAALRVDDDKALDGLDAAKLTAERVIEKAGLARPAVVERLAAAKAAEHAARRTAFNIRRRTVADRLHAALLHVNELNEEAASLDHECRSALGDEYGFPAVAYAWRPINANGIAEWWLAVEETFGNVPTRPSTRPPEKSAPKVVPKPQVASANPVPPQKPAPKPRARPVLPTEPEGDAVRVVVLRSGFETPTGLALAMGDMCDLPPSVAKEAVASGAADYAGPMVMAA